MRLFVISPGYPSENNLYNSNFVQKRLELYKNYNKNWQIEVLIYNKRAIKNNYYYFNNIKVHNCNLNGILENYYSMKPDLILIHFFHRDLFENFIKKINEPILIWVHGAEALSWKRRLFNFSVSPIKFIKYVISNSLQLRKFSSLIDYSKKTGRIKFIFVSKWMKDVCFKDTKNSTDNFEIIPNVVDTDFFDYVPKDFLQRRNILLIRNFDSKKYATDIAIKAILYLSKNYKGFKGLNFTIIGKGKLWHKLTKRIKNFSNVRLINKFLTHEEIKKYHSENGVFLCPTRQDSQGVSMCEAMSSGLVPISSNNTAILEFLNREAGYLTNNFIEIAKAIEELNDNPKLFSEKSIKVANLIRNLASFEKTIKKEIDLINSIYQENKK
ncbi:glycosyltransferase family 4 protein [Petrotoga sp. 9PW.55.5.1]|uniref:glycosyltransferase family 4 protein n=1 Tax=Petrotoga sp. 9PW.55.5.1 TaxID=1308979 RepID=UPI000DDA7D57|nr:glycosyltransferase family 4 protein [Petrotoga sp. 9PW.55.5.1]